MRLPLVIGSCMLVACGDRAPPARWQQPAPPSVAKPLELDSTGSETVRTTSGSDSTSASDVPAEAVPGSTGARPRSVSDRDRG